MNEQSNANYYISLKPEILARFDAYARAWKSFLVDEYGVGFTEAILKEIRHQYEIIIPKIPYIGGNENPMTRHLIRSTTSLMFFKVMKAWGKTAIETGKIIYNTVESSINQLSEQPGPEVTPEFMEQERQLALKSQERRYPADWVWEYVEGNGVDFNYGYDYLECGTQKFYHVLGADEFLPYYCYLDFVMHRTAGWGFSRTQTLSEGYRRCDFRWKKGGDTKKGWPPPFIY